LCPQTVTDGKLHCSDVGAVLSCMPVGRVEVFADHKADACSFLWVVKKGEAGRAVRGLHVLVEVRLLYCKYLVLRLSKGRCKQNRLVF
jgi:hypothetical protein